MTNKITVDIDVMNSANLGVKGLNVTDATGTAATYAVDAISDAIAKVSSQRSALGAVQNRLEHTIDNLDNLLRIQQLLNLVSVIQIWQKRWLSTARTTFLHRQVSLCLHRLIIYSGCTFSVTVIENYSINNKKSSRSNVIKLRILT